MNTKTFAQQSRTILMQGVENKLHYWGFTEKGDVTEEPVKIEGGYMFRGEVFDADNTPRHWQSLKMAIGRKGFDAVKEEAAYTWFNRMIAIQILSKNGYDPLQLSYAEGMQHTPMILQRARQGFYGFLSAEEQRRLKLILPDYSQDQAAFTMLLIGYCHSHTLINNVFGGIDDYTELLLPDNMLSDNGFLHLLNTTDAITDEQYRAVELIGWLYQFYISKRKDEVFAGFKKNKKAEAKDIPAATQIFTPNWIVKYMVQNTVGKLWLDLHPGSPLKKEMKYLVEGTSSEYGNPIIKEVKELKLLDPASGSGHILVEGFDLLFKMYKEEYYSDEEAVESILSNNLFGLDIDKRAMQLARFAVLLKVAKVFPAVLKKSWLPRIYAMPEPYGFSRQEMLDFLGSEGAVYEKDLSSALSLMQQAQNIGSIMRFNMADDARIFIIKRLEELQHKPSLSFYEQAVLPRIAPFIDVYTILSSHFEAVAANPPYMGQKYMNVSLKNYVNGNYINSKSDLFAVFMDVCLNLKSKSGLMGMINQHNWMFLSSYDELREKLLNDYGIASMLQLGTRTFDELTGEKVQSTTFILENKKRDQKGIFYRLVNYKNNKEKERNFLLKNNEYANVQQSDFFKIPGYPIAYWVSETIRNIFKIGILSDFVPVRKGIDTGKNELFLRFWHEVSFSKFSHLSFERKWFIYIKGGTLRKWYGNVDLIVNWENNGQDIKNYKGSTIRNQSFIKKEAITWSLTGSNGFGARYIPINCVFDNNGSSVFPLKNFEFILGSLNSIVSETILAILNPTLAFQVGDIARLPIKWDNDFRQKEIIKSNISISKTDWDSHEISWGFTESPLINDYKKISKSYEKWLTDVTRDFFQLHTNEEELNRIFIEIYGLQNELTPEISLKNITILQDELDYNALEQLRPPYEGQLVPVKRTVVMQQLISYAIGCFMGRYRLDKPGLQIAHPNPTKDETAGYSYNECSFEIDDDGIVPIMGSGCDFPDDAVTRFKNFLDVVWGEDTRIENVNFLQECLDQDVEKFMVKDFWKVHCKMYSKKPIYWLFSSPKGAFQVLAYMHRMNAFTVEKIRSKYLIEHLKSLRSKISLLEKSESSLSATESRVLDKLRRDIQECEHYDMTLKTVADMQINFDLDDGVTENYKLFKGVVAEIK